MNPLVFIAILLLAVAYTNSEDTQEGCKVLASCLTDALAERKRCEDIGASIRLILPSERAAKLVQLDFKKRETKIKCLQTSLNRTVSTSCDAARRAQCNGLAKAYKPRSKREAEPDEREPDFLDPTSIEELSHKQKRDIRSILRLKRQISSSGSVSDCSSGACVSTTTTAAPNIHDQSKSDSQEQNNSNNNSSNKSSKSSNGSNGKKSGGKGKDSNGKENGRKKRQTSASGTVQDCSYGACPVPAPAPDTTTTGASTTTTKPTTTSKPTTNKPTKSKSESKSKDKDNSKDKSKPKGPGRNSSKSDENDKDSHKHGNGTKNGRPKRQTSSSGTVQDCSYGACPPAAPAPDTTTTVAPTTTTTRNRKSQAKQSKEGSKSGESSTKSNKSKSGKSGENKNGRRKRQVSSSGTVQDCSYGACNTPSTTGAAATTTTAKKASLSPTVAKQLKELKTKYNECMSSVKAIEKQCSALHTCCSENPLCDLAVEASPEHALHAKENLEHQLESRRERDFSCSNH